MPTFGGVIGLGECIGDTALIDAPLNGVPESWETTLSMRCWLVTVVSRLRFDTSNEVVLLNLDIPEYLQAGIRGLCRLLLTSIAGSLLPCRFSRRRCWPS